MKRPRVIIIGGGPAGSTLAAMLAKEGVDVVVLERANFPRHHVGEALQPAAFELLDFHLGLRPRLEAEGFVKKFGALYYWGESRDLWSVLFDDRLDDELPGLDSASLHAGGYDYSWQVDRARFDEVLLEEAERRGAEVRQGWEAVELVRDGPRVTGVLARQGRGEAEAFYGDLVVDASGQRCLVGRDLELTKDIPDLQATATYAYFRGAGGVDGALGRNVQLVVTVPDGWVWFIPVSEEETSVGVVTSERRKLTEERFYEVIEAAMLPMGAAEPVAGPKGAVFRHSKDWSYTHDRFTGPGWLLVGDAACFTDPILSGGVDFAIRSACNAAVAILRTFGEDDPDVVEPTLIYETQLRKEFAGYLRLARYWYANNRAVDGLFWETHAIIPEDSLSTPIRAFKYLTSGRLDADAHFRIFTDAQEKKMFRALGVDKKALKQSLKRARKRLRLD